MIRVNLAFAEFMYSAIWSLGDVSEIAKPDVLVFGDMPDKNEKIKHIFDTYVVPHVRAWDSESLTQGKLASQYMMTFMSEKIGQVFDSALPPCDAPEPASLIFEWIWDAMFPGESWLLDREQQYEVVDRPEEINVIFDPNVKIPSPVIGREYSDCQPKK